MFRNALQSGSFFFDSRPRVESLSEDMFDGNGGTVSCVEASPFKFGDDDELRRDDRDVLLDSLLRLLELLFRRLSPLRGCPRDGGLFSSSIGGLAESLLPFGSREEDLAVVGAGTASELAASFAALFAGDQLFLF